MSDDSIGDGRETFVSILPQMENVHLSKPPGKIPSVMERDHGFDSYLVGYRNGEYSNHEDVTPALSLLFWQQGMFSRVVDTLAPEFGRFSSYLEGVISDLRVTVDAARFFRTNAAAIDVLNLHGLGMETYLLGWIYRLFGGDGIVYVKLDANPSFVDERDPETTPWLLNRLRRWLFDCADINLVSAETKPVYEFARSRDPALSRFPGRVLFLSNGIDMEEMTGHEREFADKADIVLHVGRIGSKQKATDIALEAWGRVAADHPDWELHLVGPTADDFDETYNEFRDRHPDAAEHTERVGFVVDRDDLYEIYARGKIIVFPSRWESWGNVMIEAGFYGNVPIASDIAPFREMTDDGACGRLCPVDDAACFADALHELLGNPALLRQLSNRYRARVRDRFTWERFCTGLANAIEDARDERE